MTPERNSPNELLRECISCGLLKEESEFPNWSKKAPRCIPCTRYLRKQKYWLNPEKGREYTNNWRKENPEYMREYLKTHKEEISIQHGAYIKVWYKENREDRLNYTKQWRVDNPEKAKILKYECSRNRRARVCSAVGSYKYEDWLKKASYYGWKCYYCGKLLDTNTLTADHYKPLAKGGSNWLSNLVPACKSCNSSKRTKYASPTNRQKALLVVQ